MVIYIIVFNLLRKIAKNLKKQKVKKKNNVKDFLILFLRFIF